MGRSNFQRGMITSISWGGRSAVVFILLK